MNLHQYDISKFEFKKIITNLFDCGPLELLHERYNHGSQFTMLDNSNTIFHQMFYKNIREENDFMSVYDLFLNEFVTSIVGEKFIYQASPTLRVHLVGNMATPEFHVDTQDGYYHPAGEMNFILPLTQCYDTNSVWVESEPNKGDYSPIKMKYGNLFQFAGGKLRHGNKTNQTPLTRVSFDFRVLPLSKYDKNYPKSSATRGTKFIVGEYYKELR